MNWTNVEQLPTANDKSLLIGTIKEHKGGGLTKNGKPFSKISVTDDAGVTKNLKVYGEHQPTVSEVGRRYQFQVGWYDYTHEGKSGRAFSGFWNPTANVSQQTQQAQQQYKPVEQKPDWDKIAEGKVLHGIICAAIQSGQMPCKTLADVVAYRDLIMGKLPLGEEKPLIEQVQDDIGAINAMDDDSDIPF